MKCGKAAGPDEVTFEIVLAIGEGIKWLHRILQVTWKEKLIPHDWRKSILVPIFKNKGNIHECCNYRSIELLAQMIKCIENPGSPYQG